MKDEELPEFAAKAAGITGWQSKHGYWNMIGIAGESVVCCDHWPKFDPATGVSLNPTFADAVGSLNWHPRTDDGDSRRLQVQLGIDVTVSGRHAAVASCINGPSVQVYADGDLCAATRLAVLRVAAEIGRAMP